VEQGNDYKCQDKNLQEIHIRVDTKSKLKIRIFICLFTKLLIHVILHSLKQRVGESVRCLWDCFFVETGTAILENRVRCGYRFIIKRVDSRNSQNSFVYIRL
jgi:hypothetical protein